MQKTYVGILFVLCLGASLIIAPKVGAVSSTVVISQVQVGDVSSATNEFIELYNNADTSVDISNWCVYYASAGSTTVGSKIACLTPSGANIHIFIPSRAYALVSSRQLLLANPNFGGDASFSATLSGTAGHVRLIDANNIEIDKVGWGISAVSAEGGMPVLVPLPGSVLQRVLTDATVYSDTDNNKSDFVLSAPRSHYIYGLIYDVQDICMNISGIQLAPPLGYGVDEQANCLPPPVDVCTNINGLQITLPPGYLLDNDGTCQPDSCLNIAGLQISVPIGMDADANGNCYAHDECSNFAGIQAKLPDGFVRSIAGDCVLEILPLEISEMLPNITGTDEGKEFIEAYNPNDVSVDMEYYHLLVGPELETSYGFPAGSVITPHGYMTFYNNQITFTLPNTASRVGLELIDSTVVYKADTYVDPAEDRAWALIDNEWQYTNQPTPGSVNLPSSVVQNIVEIAAVDTNLTPCAANQYRNPDTNRCRLITTSTATVAPCADGQYRSEVTNRCRNIALSGSTLTPCADDQYRSEETNRCRSVLGASTTTVKPCADNQYRSEETNRCRNIVQVATAPFAVEPTQNSSGNYTGWWVAGGVSALALGYGIWEWRREIGLGLKKVTSFILPGK